MAHTPTKEEYVRTMYVVALGIAAIGAIGFGIWWVMSCLPTYF
jgi:protein transport protein SEC61 subunit gamma-like protein